MNFKNEGDVKKYVKKVLATYSSDELWYFMPPANGYGRSGVPDFLGCFKGNMFAIETKFGSNNPTNNQEREIESLTKVGAQVWVVRETDVDMWKEMFSVWTALC